MKFLSPETEKEKQNIAFNKIVKCIFSCKTIDQCGDCLNMINNFSNKYKNIQYIHCSIDVLFDELKKQKMLINEYNR
jgi:hypothetical protein